MLASIALVMPTCANTFAGEKDIVILGTATPGGGFPVHGDAFPGLLHQNFSWSLYRHLVRVESSNARAFYEIEAIRNNWSARELERQINSISAISFC